MEKFQNKIQGFQIGKEIQKKYLKTPLLKNIQKMIYLSNQLQRWNKKKIIYLQIIHKLKEFNKQLKILKMIYYQLKMDLLDFQLY